MFRFKFLAVRIEATGISTLRSWCFDLFKANSREQHAYNVDSSCQPDRKARGSFDNGPHQLVESTNAQNGKNVRNLLDATILDMLKYVQVYQSHVF